MEAAALLAVGARRGVPVAVVLAVSDSEAGGGERIDAPDYEAIGVRLGAAAAAALGAEG
jgi:nucleoside phosphorylase